ncbi:MAG: hypothetical protein H8M99_15185, partial [Gloeobacteraceae cyanobacterium ES-bin-144]|nr:hypothetical protein [Verrucomicrobiales bacterium]
MNLRTLILSIALGGATLLPAAETSLDQSFHKVPNADKPWVYWWWLNGNVDERSITRDLEAMKQQGIGGLLMFDSRAYHDDGKHVVIPPSKMDFMSPEWRKMLKYSMQEAQRLGLEMSVNLSSCAGALKGPWRVEDDAPKKLVWTSAEVNGSQRLSCELRKPVGRSFWDVALFAVQHDEQAPPTAIEPVMLSSNWQDVVSKLGTKPVAKKVVNLSANMDEQG